MNALVEIQGEKYNYKIWYRDDELLRRSFKLIMFYCMDFLKDRIYYIKDLNVIAICDYNGDEVLITPKDTSSYKESILHEEDTTLFIRSKKETPFDRERIMFPMLSHT